MSVLTEEQREYMDAVLRNQPQNGKADGVAPPAPTAPVATRVRLARPAVDHLLFYDDDDARGDRRLKAVKNKGKKGNNPAGKGGWGSPLDSIDPKGCLDSGDPNYDSTEDQTFSDQGYAEPTDQTKDAIVEFKERVAAIVVEYFDSADVQEAADNLMELDSPLYQHFVVKKVVTMAMDRQPRECEMSARLLSVAFPQVIGADEMTKGFIQLLNCAEDLALDVPEAATILGVFIARAVVDDVLPPAFVTRALSLLSADRNIAVEALNYCKVQLGARHAAERVLRIWGDSVSLTVDDAKAKVALLLEEYCSSHDLKEAQACLRSLKMPFFHHELVKKALVTAIEKPVHKEDMMSLLSQMSSCGDISTTQMAMGFTRLQEGYIEDLVLDVPEAPHRFEAIVADAKQTGFLDQAWNAPQAAKAEQVV
mmetsp:Transcript_19838/g.43388  ORF Transcript_19838/g.43388 Transcript_19838/m.43388 type:complete len:423 (-) Transcript_19838:859-2127(-)